MNATKEIKKMSANELLDTYADIVETDQDWDNELTVLKFDNSTVTICGSDVLWS